MRRLLFALLCVVGLAGTATAQARPLPELLSTDTLAAWLARGAPVRLLDVRLDVWSYLKGHLPEAQYLNIETLRASRGGLPVQLLEAPAYRGVFQRLGLDPSVPVVVYSAGETLNIDATWVTWLLTAMGHPRVYLLDGGFYKWSFEHREMARKVSPDCAGGRLVESARLCPRHRIARRGAAGGGAGRGPAGGRSPTGSVRGRVGTQMRRGHIPGALNHWWQDDLETSGFGRVFKPVDVLRAAYLQEGITPDRDIILYCNTVHRSESPVVRAARAARLSTRADLPGILDRVGRARGPADGDRPVALGPMTRYT
jgi:thiosulfate/3-mercaptopyruvate sulfurtransferase